MKLDRSEIHYLGRLTWCIPRNKSFVGYEGKVDKKVFFESVNEHFMRKIVFCAVDEFSQNIFVNIVQTILKIHNFFIEECINGIRSG